MLMIVTIIDSLMIESIIDRHMLNIIADNYDRQAIIIRYCKITNSNKTFFSRSNHA